MKQYQNEKAIISLTSWKARINTVSKTLFSLIQQCPGFHIVLVLSEEEFPKKEAELPENLMLFIKNDLIELLWVYKNYKSFKKVLFTMDKYREVPVISADDDCIYTCNYAQELYDKWAENKNCLITYKADTYKNLCHQWGAATLHPPYFYNHFGLDWLNDLIISKNLDDVYYLVLREVLNLTLYNQIEKPISKILYFHDNNDALSKIYLENDYCTKTRILYENMLTALKNS